MLRRFLQRPALRFASIALLLAACDPADDGELIDDDAPLSSYESIFEGAPVGKDLPFEIKADGPAPLHHTDLLATQSEVKSQGKRGVCSIFATAALMEHLYIKAGVEDPDFSEQYLQWSTKFELGVFRNTSGSNNTFNLQAINRFGIPEEEAWPYEALQWDTTNDPACVGTGEDLPTRCYTNGEPSEETKAAEKFFLPRNRSLSTRRAAIMDHIRTNGTAVAIGLDFFYQSWNHRKSTLPTTSDNWDRGIVMFPNDADIEESHKQRAGHAVVIVGWDSELEVPKRDRAGEIVRDAEGNPVVEKGFFIIKNSWGTAGFGIENPHGAGYGFLSMDYVEEFGNAQVADLPEIAPEEPEPGEADTFESAPSLAIPDNDETGVTDTIVVDTTGPVSRVSVTVDITHTFRGDLVVALRKGDKRVLLHDRTGGGQTNLAQTFAIEADFDGIDRAGDWTLEVSDTARVDTGTLGRWTLAIE
jgi:hypothetical protein